MVNNLWVLLTGVLRHWLRNQQVENLCQKYTLLFFIK